MNSMDQFEWLYRTSIKLPHIVLKHKDNFLNHIIL